MNTNRIEKIKKSFLSAMANSEAREWPPTCIAFMYQPTRPEYDTIQKRNNKEQRDRFINRCSHSK